MIRFVVMWLAMAGGPQQPTKPVFWHTVTPQNLEQVCGQAPNGDWACPKHKPDEYVIEIRTKRTLDRVKLFDCDPKDKTPYCGHPEPKQTCPNGQYVYDFFRHDDGALYRECLRTTKTLWIDGQKIGVIKETQEK